MTCILEQKLIFYWIYKARLWTSLIHFVLIIRHHVCISNPSISCLTKGMENCQPFLKWLPSLDNFHFIDVFRHFSNPFFHFM